MEQVHLPLLEIARLGIGVLFLIAAWIDIKTKNVIFKLMTKKHIKYKDALFVGAVAWKALTSTFLILNIFIFWAAILLALYIFIASCIFQNFWAVPHESRHEAMICFVTNVAVSFGLLAVASGYQ